VNPILVTTAIASEIVALSSVVIGADSPTADPVVFFLSQGVLGVVCFLLYKEYKDEKNKREALMQKLIDDYIPLLTRGTEAMERMAESEAANRPARRRAT
jgi:hypothetical protein